jgi:hypothetical protein
MRRLRLHPARHPPPLQEHRRARREGAVHVTPGGEESVFRYGDEPQPGHPAPAWKLERFMTPEILRFNEEFGVEILPEEDLPEG